MSKMMIRIVPEPTAMLLRLAANKPGRLPQCSPPLTRMVPLVAVLVVILSLSIALVCYY